MRGAIAASQPAVKTYISVIVFVDVNVNVNVNVT
jgi:hypothetical protein